MFFGAPGTADQILRQFQRKGTPFEFITWDLFNQKITNKKNHAFVRNALVRAAEAKILDRVYGF